LASLQSLSLALDVQKQQRDLGFSSTLARSSSPIMFNNEKEKDIDPVTPINQSAYSSINIEDFQKVKIPL